MSSTLSILITVFDEQERRKAMAAWSAVATVGLVGGPVLGGVLIAGSGGAPSSSSTSPSPSWPSSRRSC
ncbi:hypothetical protein [Nonomuraea turkmeniaca]|uniref:hypothetical protein n=1 Tax=Nonomuraea turkmeniaca TaxID=103838 RepID=UPI001B87ED26|nr:hypothetical protein [Nonomuraea turkmeniaca]